MLNPSSRSRRQILLGATVAAPLFGIGISRTPGLEHIMQHTSGAAGSDQLPASGAVSVRSFDAAGDEVKNDTAAFAAALDHCHRHGTALVIPSGQYLLDAQTQTGGRLNFAAQGLNIIGIGRPVLRFKGRGNGFVMDAGPNGQTIGEMVVEGLVIEGLGSVADGFYSRGIVRSAFRNIEVRNVAQKGFNIKHAVCNKYDCLMISSNIAKFAVNPSVGIYLGNNGIGYYTADCLFLNVVVEGFDGTGIELSDASGCLFVSGTSEGVALGLSIDKRCYRNSFISMWCEANSGQDLVIRGNGNRFDGCNLGSNGARGHNVVISGAGNIFNGGFVRVAEVATGSIGTLFLGTQFSNHHQLGLLGEGYQAVGCLLVDIDLQVTGTIAT